MALEATLGDTVRNHVTLELAQSAVAPGLAGALLIDKAYYDSIAGASPAFVWTAGELYEFAVLQGGAPVSLPTDQLFAVFVDGNSVSVQQGANGGRVAGPQGALQVRKVTTTNDESVESA